MRILFVTPECAPWVKTGGLGEVSADLPAALAALGLDVTVLLPAYPTVRAAAGDTARCAGIAPHAGLPAAALLQARLPTGVSALLLHCPELFDRDGGPYADPGGQDHVDNALRFGLLSRTAALIGSGASPLPWAADVVHCNDWPTALAPAYLALDLPEPAVSVMSIHNLAFQGLFPLEVAEPLGLPPGWLTMEGVEFWGRLSFLKAGLLHAQRIGTVSPTYAREILTDEFGCGLQGVLSTREQRLVGILNGIDTDTWDPQHDRHLARPYGPMNLYDKQQNKRALQEHMGLAREDGAFLLGMVSRLTEQKGVDLVLELLPQLVEQGMQVVAVGNGEARFEDGWRDAAARWPRQVAALIGFDEPLAHRVEAGCDAFLMPSRFEPCGLNQMYSQRYGTPPIVRATGGLADSVEDVRDPHHVAEGHTGTGFCFGEASAGALLEAVGRAHAAFQDAAAWQAILRNGMARDFGWRRSARLYRALYESMLREAGRGIAWAPGH